MMLDKLIIKLFQYVLKKKKLYAQNHMCNDSEKKKRKKEDKM